MPVTRFLSHLVDAGYSPNTVCGYGYDLRHLARFLTERSLGWNDVRPATALEFLGCRAAGRGGGLHLLQMLGFLPVPRRGAS